MWGNEYRYTFSKLPQVLLDPIKLKKESTKYAEILPHIPGKESQN